MSRWQTVVALSLFVVAAGVSLGLVSQRHHVASLTADDYIEIEQLYYPTPMRLTSANQMVVTTRPCLSPMASLCL